MSTKKIEGYADGILAERPHNSIRSITLSTDKRFEDLSPATLVIHSGEHEPVYTHSEVRAILHDMRSWISPDDGEEGRMWETRAKSHGIVLDPA